MSGARLRHTQAELSNLISCNTGNEIARVGKCHKSMPPHNLIHLPTPAREAAQRANAARSLAARQSKAAIRRAAIKGYLIETGNVNPALTLRDLAERGIATGVCGQTIRRDIHFLEAHDDEVIAAQTAYRGEFRAQMDQFKAALA